MLVVGSHRFEANIVDRNENSAEVIPDQMVDENQSQQFNVS